MKIFIIIRDKIDKKKSLKIKLIVIPNFADKKDNFFEKNYKKPSPNFVNSLSAFKIIKFII